MSTAIVIGSFSSGTPTYSNAQNNSTSSGFGNNYTISHPSGQPSDDIFYKFTIQNTAEVELSHCASGFDTYMHLLNSDGTRHTSNDDNGPLCTGVRSSIKVTLPAGTV